MTDDKQSTDQKDVSDKESTNQKDHKGNKEDTLKDIPHTDGNVDTDTGWWTTRCTNNFIFLIECLRRDQEDANKMKGEIMQLHAR